MDDDVDFGTPNNQISEDVHGSDNPILLSPQWLLPKPGENKSGGAAGENSLTPSSGFGRRPDVLKSMKNDEGMNDIPKKKDVFRPTVLDMDSGPRDEERDTNSSVRRDRWREGDKEQLGDTRKADRWIDNPSARNFGEARRTPSERWTDSGDRDTNHDQRRDSKWNTRWGPDDKDTEGICDKWMDSTKDGVMSGLSHHNHHAMDEIEGDPYLRWRISAQNRGKLEPPHHQTSTTNKQGSSFVYGRGRGENAPPNFSHGWGRVGSGGNSNFPSQSFATVSERGEIGHGEPSALKYSRIKLLDVYMKTDMRFWHSMVDTVVPVPSLTQEEALELLELCVLSFSLEHSAALAPSFRSLMADVDFGTPSNQISKGVEDHFRGVHLMLMVGSSSKAVDRVAPQIQSPFETSRAREFFKILANKLSGKVDGLREVYSLILGEARAKVTMAGVAVGGLISQEAKAFLIWLSDLWKTGQSSEQLDKQLDNIKLILVENLNETRRGNNILEEIYEEEARAARLAERSLWEKIWGYQPPIPEKRVFSTPATSPAIAELLIKTTAAAEDEEYSPFNPANHFEW